jgi:hypothetical protein
MQQVKTTFDKHLFDLLNVYPRQLQIVSLKLTDISHIP